MDDDALALPVAADQVVTLVRVVRGQKVLLDSDFAARLDALEARYSDRFAAVFAAISELMAPPAPGRWLGFATGGRV
jgi:hypothetical protein